MPRRLWRWLPSSVPSTDWLETTSALAACGRLATSDRLERLASGKFNSYQANGSEFEASNDSRPKPRTYMDLSVEIKLAERRDHAPQSVRNTSIAVAGKYPSTSCQRTLPFSHPCLGRACSVRSIRNYSWPMCVGLVARVRSRRHARNTVWLSNSRDDDWEHIVLSNSLSFVGSAEKVRIKRGRLCRVCRNCRFNGVILVCRGCYNRQCLGEVYFALSHLFDPIRMDCGLFVQGGSTRDA